MKKIIFLLGIILTISLNIAAQTVQEIMNLRTEYLKNPIGIDAKTPRLSWELNSNVRGTKQTAYEIIVSKDINGLEQVWNSGKIQSDKSLNIRYSGNTLVPSTRYYWHVNIWDNNNTLIKSNEEAFFETGLLDAGWGVAKWIKTTASTTGIPMFRKKINIEKEIKSAKIYSSALGVYDLFINGKRVGNLNKNGEVIYDEFKPGWTDYRKSVQYTTYDVSTLLQSGQNAICAQVASGWWKGAISHDIYKNYYGNSDLSLIVKLVIEFSDGSNQHVVTDAGWLASTASAIIMSDLYIGETYDARLESNWKSADFDDSGWVPSVINNTFTGKLKAFIGPAIQIRSELTLTPVHATIYQGTKSNGQTYGMINTLSENNGQATIAIKTGQTVIYDFGQNMVGWVKFTVKGASGTNMKLRFGEMLNDNGATSRGNDGPGGSIYVASYRTAISNINYILKGNVEGETYNPNFTNSGFRYCEVTANGDIEISSIKGIVIGSATEEGSSFVTSNPLINKLYNNIVWGQRGNFFSVVTDCPQRDERLGWTGDMQISSTAAYNADVASFYRKWLGDLRDSQRSDGAYTDVAPDVGWVTSYGTGAWAEVAIITPWSIYLMYDDKDIISENFEAMEKYMNYLKTKAGGGYLYNGGRDLYGDWLSYENTDKRYISVCYYAYAAQLMSKMSKLLSTTIGDTYDLKSIEYNTLYSNIKNEYRIRYVNVDGTLKLSTQTAYLLALKLDLFPNEIAKKNGIEYLKQSIVNNGNKLKTGFLGGAILNQMLSQFGETNTAYNLLLQRGNPSWLYSIDQGATTVWERWDSYTIEKGFGDFNMNSFNHYSFSAISEWMFRYMAGIESDESAAGFKHIILQPMPDNRITLPSGQEKITLVDATYNSYYGDIQSKWTKGTDGKFTYTITIPANSTATLYLPIASEEDNIYEGSILAENAMGVTLTKKENGKAVFELESGTFIFKFNNNTIITTPETKKIFPIYPNPVSTKLNIAAEPINYCITDLTGKKLIIGNDKDIDVEILNSGVYFIKAGENTYKFIKN